MSRIATCRQLRPRAHARARQGLGSLQALRVVVGYACNYRCRFCYQRHRGGGFLGAAELAALLDGLPARFAPRFATLMGGEPTLCPDLRPMVAYLRRRYPAAELSLTTNGSASLEAYLALAALGLDNLTFSVPTLRAREYPGVTSQRAQSLERYLAKILAFKSRADVAVRVNARASAGRSAALVRFCKAKGLKLTLCEDLVSGARARAQRLRAPGMDLVLEDDRRRIWRDGDGFEVWQYRHVRTFDYSNLIVLPDGTLTEDFADVLAQRGRRSA